MLQKYYLGGFFWVPIPHKHDQNMSGFAGVGTCKLYETLYNEAVTFCNDKSIENMIILTFYTFRFNSILTTDTSFG